MDAFHERLAGLDSRPSGVYVAGLTAGGLEGPANGGFDAFLAKYP